MDASADKAGIAALGWFTGSWSGEHDGGIYEEHWTMPEGGIMVGMSKLTIGGRVVFFEYARIVQNKDGTIDYVAQPVGNPPTKFRMTSSGARTVVFENPQNDDPKIIRYERVGDSLQAVTEGTKPDGTPNVHPYRMQRTTLQR